MTLRVITVAATILFVIMFVSLIVNFVSLGRLNARKKSLQNQLDTLDAQIESGKQLIEDRTTQSYIEQYAREQLGMMREDEKLFIGK